MSGWTIVRNGTVTLEHLSTSSQIVMTMTDYPDGYDEAPVIREFYLDYPEFDSLCKCIEMIMPQILGPPQDALKHFSGHKVSALLDKHLPADGEGTERERVRMALHNAISQLKLTPPYRWIENSQ